MNLGDGSRFIAIGVDWFTTSKVQSSLVGKFHLKEDFFKQGGPDPSQRYIIFHLGSDVLPLYVSNINEVIKCVGYLPWCSLVPRPIPSFLMLHAEKCISACTIEKLGIGLGTRLHVCKNDKMYTDPIFLYSFTFQVLDGLSEFALDCEICRDMRLATCNIQLSYA